MAQTVIGFFDEASEAQRAVEQLQSSGISRDRVDISRGHAGAESSAGSSRTGSADTNPVSGSARDENSVSRTSDDRTVDKEGRNTNVFTDFFNNLFGGKSNNDDAERYSRVASGSNTIVTVHAQTEDEAERAADILDDCGAIDVDERSAQYGYSSRSGDTGNMRARSRIVARSLDENMRLRNSGDSRGDLL